MLDFIAAIGLGAMAALIITAAIAYILGFVLSLPVAFIEAVRMHAPRPHHAHSGRVAWHA